MNDHFATPKPKQTKQSIEEGSDEYIYRNEIAVYSLKKAAQRVHTLKSKNIKVDQIKQEEILEEKVSKIKNYELTAAEFADDSSISKGVLCCNDKYYTTVGWSGECKVWRNLSAPELVTSLVGHKYQVFDVDYHPSVESNDPDIPNIATCGADCIVRLWTFDVTEKVQNCLELSGHQDRVNKVKFHPNGLHVVSASYDKTACVWDIEKEKQVMRLAGHQGSIHTMSIHPDGSLIVGYSKSIVYRRFERGWNGVGFENRSASTSTERSLQANTVF